MLDFDAITVRNVPDRDMSERMYPFKTTIYVSECRFTASLREGREQDGSGGPVNSNASCLRCRPLFSLLGNVSF